MFNFTMFDVLYLLSRFAGGDAIFSVSAFLAAAVAFVPALFIKRRWLAVVVFLAVGGLLAYGAHHAVEAFQVWYRTPLGPPLFPVGSGS